MTKTRRSSQRTPASARRSASAIATPLRSTPRRGSSAKGIWDFDAPNFYDFASSKTPGRASDKWFEVAHPTPAIGMARAPRLSTDSFLSPDGRDSLLPTRPSLSPSRIVVEANGKLSFGDSQASGDDETDAEKQTPQDVRFSDTDDEIEFNNWKSAQAFTASGLDDPDANGDDGEGLARHSVSSVGTEPESAGRPSDEPVVRTRPQRVSAAKAGCRIAKKMARPLTVPVSAGFGFMRPTKGAAQRLLAKKRDKANRQMIADAINRTVVRRLSRTAGSKLTVPAPFQFRGERGAKDTQPEVEHTGAGSSTPPKPSRKAQECLATKLSAKRKAAENDDTAGAAGAPRRSSPAKVAKKLQATVPKTPQFAKSKRVRRALVEATTTDDAAPRQAKRAIGAKQAPGIHLSPPKLTVPQPFVFRSDVAASRSLQRLRDEMAKLRAEEAAMREFHANPLPEFPTPKKPEYPPSTLHASPFSLATDSRGEAYQRQLRARLAELEERRLERMRFKARSIPHSLDHPFVPQPSTRPLTTVEEILLKTELRSEERHAYDEDRNERERIREDVLARKRQEEERREEEEIRQLRKQLVHKAQPIRHFKPVDIKPSDRPLTVPKTPEWH
ncbi:hypothetical protein H4R21_001216, partial [Coemansia helicoidea]